MLFLSSEEAGSVQAARGLAACWRTRGGCGAVHSTQFLLGDPSLTALLSGWETPFLLGVSPPRMPNGGMWPVDTETTVDPLPRATICAARAPGLNAMNPTPAGNACNEPNPSRQLHLNAITEKYSTFRLRESCCRHQQCKGKSAVLWLRVLISEASVRLDLFWLLCGSSTFRETDSFLKHSFKRCFHLSSLVYHSWFVPDIGKQTNTFFCW